MIKEQNLLAINLLTIANISQCVKHVLVKIAGNDISNSISGSKITTEIISSLVKQRLRAKLTDTK